MPTEKSQMVEIRQGDVNAYQRDGVVCLRNIFDVKWIDQLLRSWNEMESLMLAGGSDFDLPEALLEDDHKLREEIAYMSDPANSPDGVEPGFMSCKWTYFWNKGVRDFVHNSPAGEVVGRVLGVDSVRFFWDQMFVKKCNTGLPTYWHTDQPAWPTVGDHLPSLWIPLTPVDRELSSLEYLAGSHKRYDSRDWPRTYNATMLDMPEGRKPFTDYERYRDHGDLEFVSYGMQPGDAVLFSPELYHGAGANNHPSQDRIAISLRWIGPNVTWDPRPECVNVPGMPLDKMVAGERPTDDTLFPVVWQAA